MVSSNKQKKSEMYRKIKIGVCSKCNDDLNMDGLKGIQFEDPGAGSSKKETIFSKKKNASGYKVESLF